MQNKYVASPYTYNDKNKPTSWGVWNKATDSWTPNLFTRKKDAEKMAVTLGELGK